jgi:hypothetical protein
MITSTNGAKKLFQRQGKCPRGRYLQGVLAPWFPAEKDILGTATAHGHIRAQGVLGRSVLGAVSTRCLAEAARPLHACHRGHANSAGPPTTQLCHNVNEVTRLGLHVGARHQFGYLARELT